MKQPKIAVTSTMRSHIATMDQPQDITDGSLYESQYRIQPSIVIMIFTSKITRLDPLHNAFGKRVLYFMPSLPVSSMIADLPTTLKSPTSNGNRTNHATTNFKNNEVNIISPFSLCRYFCKHPFTKHYYYITLLLICQEELLS